MASASHWCGIIAVIPRTEWAGCDIKLRPGPFESDHHDSPPPVPPDADGLYDIAIPGKTVAL
jgi:hypothetical protein